MPFKSEKQRKLFWAAKSSARLRRKARLKRSAVDKMTSHDSGGKLPKVSNNTKKALIR